jgi:zinc-ribbon domain
MFCQYCGNPLDEGARFCKSCGNAVPAAAAIAPRLVAADPVQVFRHHVRVLGIVWLSYSVFRIIMSIWILAFSHYFLPVMQDVMSRSAASFPFPIIRFLHVIYAISSAYGAATGILGVIAGAMLLQKKPTARILVIVAAFLSVLSFPLGTAVAVYTLIVLMPQDAARNYQQLTSVS